MKVKQKAYYPEVKWINYGSKALISVIPLWKLKYCFSNSRTFLLNQFKNDDSITKRSLGKSWSKSLTVWSIAPNATFSIVMSSSKIFWSCQRPSRQRSLILAVDRSIKIRVSLISPERHSTTHLNGSWHENTMDTDRRSGRVVSCSTLLSQV